MSLAFYIITALVAFVIGSIPTGYIVARFYHVDIRRTGSHNIGATNVLRSVNRWAGRAVFAVDLFKGLIPTFMAPLCFPQSDHLTLQCVACFMTIMGHNYTPWLNFKGGKGVAAAMGGFLALCWPAQVTAGAVWLVVFAVWRYVSLASIVSVLMLPVFVFAFTRDLKVTGFAIMIAALTIVRHKDNIARFLSGSEYRFGK